MAFISGMQKMGLFRRPTPSGSQHASKLGKKGRMKLF